MFFKEINEIDLGETPIDNIFIDIFMPMANGTYVKVYLLAYKYALDASISNNMTNKSLARNLNIPLTDVLSAWDFWEEKGIIKKHIKADEEEWNYSIEFLNLKKLYIENILKTNISKKNKTTPDELITINQNPNIQKMFNYINKIINRSLVPNEKIQILDIMDKYNMGPDMIKSAYAYAKQKSGIKNIKYIEGIIRNWYDNKIYTLEDLEEYLAKKSERFITYKKIFKELGFYREPTMEERKTMDSWIDDFGFSIDLILYACSKSKNTSNPSISYINAIIKKWHEKGFKTIEDVKKFAQKRSERLELYKIIFEALGFKKPPSKEEIKVMDSWIDDFNFSMDLVLHACSKSKNTSTPSVAYINSILESWHKKGFKTIKDTEKEKLEKKYESKIIHTKTKFHNFDQRTSQYTPEELERIVLEKQKKKFK
ncbi:DnaD domain protein [Tepidibacter thalassicus]|uniref:DnaD and phage-associated domain-containing protein n=1 Tax=Tepidibacter thalassicus DSM 15285 TaxID=1123350 RepID=A0A1M5TNH4_9FIRM|nr:DnaD domain protein [Tepidibacter thalassicus]SHH52327.1 DnaD and phage-associated domain-containing protein [Tepidibacter thalassicus DSM 15285]